MIEEQPNVFIEKMAAHYLGVSPATLRSWRAENKGPRYFRAGEKLVRYRRTDLDSWIEARLSAQALLTCAAILEDKARLVRGQATGINVTALLDVAEAIRAQRDRGAGG